MQTLKSVFSVQMKYLESVIRKHEAEVLSLEEDKVRLKRVRLFVSMFIYLF